MKLKMYTLPLALAAFASFSLVPAYSQGIITGAVSGTVTDASGAVIPNATVTAVDNAKGTSFTTTSRSDGNFSSQRFRSAFIRLRSPAVASPPTRSAISR